MKLDPLAREYVQRSQHQRQAQATPAEPERVTRLRPHETNRKDRQMNVTFPTGTWTEALRQMAEHWGLRPTDLVTWCVSLAITAIITEEVNPPSGAGRKQHHVACEWMDLPWEPETDKR